MTPFVPLPHEGGLAHRMPQPAARWAEVAGHARSMRSREASTRRDRALGEPLLTPRKSSCPSPSPLSSVRCKRHESVMDSAMNTVLGRTALLPLANVRARKDASCARSPLQSDLVAHPVGNESTRTTSSRFPTDSLGVRFSPHGHPRCWVTLASLCIQEYNHLERVVG